MRPPTTEPLLRLTGVRAGYGAGPVLHDLDLAVEAGSVHAVVGHNGAGKSTLIHVVAGLVRSTSGQLRLAGREITGLPAHRRARAGIRLVPQGRRVWSSLTVAEHLAIAYRKPAAGRAGPAGAAGPAGPAGPAGSGEGWSVPRVLELLPQLAARRRHRGSQLSGGEQQMLAIARALLGQPRLLLLDEPTEGLAPVLATEVRDLIGQLARGGLAILLAAPHPELPAAVAERFTLLTAGRVTATGSAGLDRLRTALAPAGGPAGAASGLAGLPAGGSALAGRSGGAPEHPGAHTFPVRADRPGWADILPVGPVTSRADRQPTDRRTIP